MNEQELRELDCWLAEHVLKSAAVTQVSPRRFRSVCKMDEFQGGVGCGGFKSIALGWDYLWYQIDHPTTARAAAMAVMEVCAAHCGELMIRKRGGLFCVSGANGVSQTVTYGDEAKTLPLAICLFSKKLFEKGPQ